METLTAMLCFGLGDGFMFVIIFGELIVAAIVMKLLLSMSEAHRVKRKKVVFPMEKK